jgi:hypothetical protein
MMASATKPERKRLRWFVPTDVGQTQNCAKPVEGAKNRDPVVRQVPVSRHTDRFILNPIHQMP